MPQNYFPILARTSLVMVFFVILAGAVVRTTGSGMGCPDWPKCFGAYIPPTDISQLPPDYKIRFMVKGKEIADFDAFKTWTEYINRLLGAVLGVVVIALCVSSLFSSPPEKKKGNVALSFFLLGMTGFVGWLGSVVVATDLEPFKITLHMLAAFLILALAVILLYRSKNHAVVTKQSDSINKKHNEQNFRILQVLPHYIRLLLWLALGMTILQVVLGTQVREQIDTIAKTLEFRWRDLWVQQLSWVFDVHRALSWSIVGINYVVWRVIHRAVSNDSRSTQEAKKSIWNYAARITICRAASVVMICILAEVFIGIVLTYFSMPKFAQPLHLLCAGGIFAAQVYAIAEVSQHSDNS